MPDTRSPPEGEEKDGPSSDLVSPRTSHHASRSSTPGTSHLDGSPRYLDFMPNPPSPGPPSQPNMADEAAPPWEPNSPPTTSGQITTQQATSQQALPSTMHRPQLPRDTVVRSTAPSTNGFEDVACLSEITHLLRLQKYHKRRCLHAQEELHRLQIATAKAARLRLTAHSVQRTLAECIRAEDKSSFANLLHAFQHVCEDAAKTSHPPVPGANQSPVAAKPFESFLNDISSASRNVVLDLLAKLRYDGHFLAERISALTPKELNALLPERVVSRSSDSVFASSTRTSRNSRPLGFAVDAQVDVLNAYAYGSPLEALIFGPGLPLLDDQADRRRTTEVWATVCAKVITEQKPGSERLVPALLDIWSNFEPWLGKDRLETWMLQTLQRGAFVLEQPTKQTFRARVEGRPDVSAQDEARIEAFYAEATDSLLALFGDQHSPSVIPPGALSFCQAVSQKLRDSPQQRGFPSFILTRWLFNSFIMDVINLPEAHMMTTDHYTSDLSRQRILREIAVRAQKAVFDVAYYFKHGNPIMPETANRVNSIMARISGPPSRPSIRKAQPVPEPSPFLVLSLRDVTTILSALYPRRRPISISSDSDISKSGLQSSASSVSGFSLFRNTRTPDQYTADPFNPFLKYGETANANVSDVSLVDDDPNEIQVKDACIELEDLATRRTGAIKESWDVVAVETRSQSLCSMREKCSEIRLAQRNYFLSTNQSVTLLDSLGDQHREVAHQLKPLLHLYGHLDSSEPLENGATYSSQTWTKLERLFENAVRDCQTAGDYAEAQRWFQRLHDVHAAILAGDSAVVLQRILHALQGSAQRSISEWAELETVCERWVATLQPGSSMHSMYLKPIIQQNEALRDKMWYVADVRTSAAYEEARLVASALRIMGKPSKTPKTKTSQPLRHWPTSRYSIGSLHIKSEAQILDILSARSEYCGPNKLSDDQARATLQWMQRENIDNLCRGEERLHKLFLEIRKCVDLVSNNSPSDNSLLWSNTLFARDTSLRTRDSPPRRSHFLPNLYGNTLSSDYLSLSSQLRSNDCLSNTSHTLSNSSSRDYLDARSPTLTNRSSVPFWSPAMSEVDSPSSATSVASSQTQWAPDVAPTPEPSNSLSADSQALEKLRQRVTGLMLSDLTSTLFNDGSETDHAFWTGLGLELAERYFRSIQTWHSSAGSQTPTADSEIPAKPTMMRFDFDNAFENLMLKFVASSNPTTKLKCLYDIDRLLGPYMKEQRSNMSPAASFVKGVQDLKLHTGADDMIETSIAGFRDLFAKSSLRPKTIFRDMQSIASLLPAAVLHNTPEGKAFANAAVAITRLKTEVRTIMVETADSIIAYHSNNRGHGRSSSIAQQERDSATFAAPSPPAEDVARYTMADAAHLLQITAKEGHIVAQRELGTLYLTHPELMDRIIAPFTRPKDVFKEELEARWKKNQDPHRLDPLIMCVAHHWMTLSSKANDSLAKETLKQLEDM
ncbi:hypothetical protein CB0940_09730 [Cercospora beticola]|uniref:Uncharacterized protein n=1 Tax=Cercospora beticola TaxID=122368 RepID=A0A2G5HFT7_CERBT|nr:hypothetical protein CB0940_09730 [Cercospora beticola]PIA91400.1 hypothetical protein CB0940_09730 [Cercospora beticola]WPB05930.1 hypothetical protein RHO25_010585 [Cercospora beticola]